MRTHDELEPGQSVAFIAEDRRIADNCLVLARGAIAGAPIVFSDDDDLYIVPVYTDDGSGNTILAHVSSNAIMEITDNPYAPGEQR